MLNLPQQSWVWRAVGLKAASLLPLQRGTTETAPRRHTQPPVGLQGGTHSPSASAVKLALACLPQAGLKSLFLTGSKAPHLQAFPGGWVPHPPHVSLARAESGELSQFLGSRGIACTYTGSVRTPS